MVLLPVVPSMVETTALGAAMAAGAAEGIGVWDMKSASSTIGVTQYKPDMPEKRTQNKFSDNFHASQLELNMRN